jgi:AraC-like DNA-binding protein
MKRLLPRLACGNGKAASFELEREILDEFRKTRRPIRDFSFRAPTAEARTRIHNLEVNGLILTNSASDAYRAELDSAPSLSVLLPTFGNGTLRRNGSTLNWRCRTDILVLNFADPQTFQAERNACLVIHPEGPRLRDTIHLMYGEGGRISASTMLYPASNTARDFHQAFLSLCSLIESAGLDAGHLAAIGIDDVFYRVLSELLSSPAEGHGSGRNARPPSRGMAALDAVCDHILQFPSSPLTLSQMERMTALTSRALRYAFQKRFNCSPRQWQRNAYLDHAREIIMRSDEPLSVRALSYRLGFSSPQSFAAFYRQRFGELPSMAIAARKRQKPGSEA